MAHPELLGIEGDEETYSELHAAFAWEVERASAVTILAGYFNPEYIIRLLSSIPQRPAARRRTCRVRVAIGIDPGLPLMGEWLRLCSLKSAIKDAGFKNTEVFAIRDGSVHFHTKVYGFIRKTQRSWYVGSANPGNRRHEMMVRVSGRHDALSAYADAALSKGIEVDETPPVDEAQTLEGFFASGCLAYRPPVANLFTFDAVRLKPDERKALDDRGGEWLGIPYAAVTTKGYGFRLAEAMDEAEVLPVDEGWERGTPKRLSHRRLSVETSLGFWVPRPYSEKIERDLAAVRTRRQERLARFLDKLVADGGEERATQAFSAYIQAVNAMLGECGLRERPVAEARAGFANFLSARVKMLKDCKRRERYCRTLVLTPMPNIWSDETASREFIASFFEDVAWRASAVGGRPRILRAFQDGLGGDVNLSDPDDTERALVKRLANRPWADAVWFRAEDDDEDIGD